MSQGIRYLCASRLAAHLTNALEVELRLSSIGMTRMVQNGADVRSHLRQIQAQFFLVLKASLVQLIGRSVGLQMLLKTAKQQD